MAIILSFLFPTCSSSSYVPYVFTWKTGNEFGVVNYKIQKSSNNKNWSTIGGAILPSLRPDSNIYQVNLPNTKIAYYYRLYITMVNGSYNSDPVYLKTTAK